MDRSAIILAGGSSAGFNSDKGLLELEGKLLLNHMVDAVRGLADEVVVVTNTQERANTYSQVVSSPVRFAVDVQESKGPLVGALSGFESVSGDYSLVLPLDAPFVSQEVLSLFFDLCVGKAAVIPRRTSSEIEPMPAVYNTKQALVAAEEALAENMFDLEAMVEKLRGVRYISTMVIEQLDPDLKTFFRINTPVDLKRATVVGKPRPAVKAKRRR